MKASFIILIIFFSFRVFAQSPLERINVNTLNTKYLEHLIKTKVDSVRATKNLPPVVNDSILYVAAKYHSDWMNANKKFSHKEKEIPEKYDPQKRVEYFGGVNYLVGENIIKSYLNKSIENKKGKRYVNETYEDMANDFVTGWVNSPGHYANIITPTYEITGLAISINKDKKLIYATQKFAKVQFKYEFTENKKMFGYSDFVPPKIQSSFDEISRERISKKFAWKIKAPRDSIKKCQSCNDAIDNRFYKDKLYFKGRSIVFYSNNVGVLEEILQHRRDGLAVEFVSYEPFDCGNPEYYTKPSRRNNQSIINGTVVQPKYKRHLKRGFKKAKYSKFFKIRKKGTAEYFEMKLGKMPKNLEGYNEMNLLVLKSKKLCRVVHFSDYCGEKFTDATLFKMDSNLVYYPFKYLPKPGKIHFEIPFERGKSDYKFEDVKDFLGTFNQTDFVIKDAKIKAYSSLEGSEEINHRLQTQRAESVLSTFSDQQEKSFNKDIQTAPNWELFESQIELSPQLKGLIGLSQEQIKDKLSDKSFAKNIEPFLAKQRLGIVDLEIEYTAKKEFLADTILKEIKDFVEGYGGRSFSEKDEKLIFGMQYTLYALATENLCSDNQLDLVPQLLKRYRQYHEQQLWINWQLGRYKENRGMRKFYGDIRKLKNPSAIAQFTKANMAIDQIEEYGFYNDEDDAIVDGYLHNAIRTNPNRKDELYDIKVYYYLYLINYFNVDSPTRDDNKLALYANKIVPFLMELKRPEEFNYRVAEALVQAEQDVPAYTLLQWMYPRAKMDKTKALYAKMGYYHNQEHRQREYHQWLIDFRKEVSHETWCNLFVGPCNISFQVFDDEILRDFYCEECKDVKNYAERPEDWVVK